MTSMESPIIIDDWDEPLSTEDLYAIDALFEAASASSLKSSTFPPSTPSSSSSLKTPRPISSAGDNDEDRRPKIRRRLPRSIEEGVDGWSKPKPAEEIDAIHTALEAASASRSTPLSAPPPTTTSSSSCKISRDISSTGDGKATGWPESRRSFPGSFSCSDAQGGSPSFALTPCPRTRVGSYVSQQARYSVLNFPGRIVYCRTAEEVENATLQIFKLLEVKRQELGRAILGVDIEWKPSFSHGVPQGKAAVLQICGDKSHCYVLHIIHSGIPNSLKSLLEDPTSIKVGVAIDGDSVKMFQDHNVSIKPVQDLSGLANQKKLVGVAKQWSLAGLVQTLTSKQLLKPKNIRLGNWEANILSEGQLKYAATDAFASWYLYEVLNSFPDLGEQQNHD